jgi:hypothetical protein
MTRLRSSSIYYALFLSIVIGVLLGGMVLFSGMNRQFQRQLNIEKQLRDNALSGVEYGLAFSDEIPADQSLDLRLFGEGIDSVKIRKKQWGAFVIIESKATHGNYSVSKIALAGRENNSGDPNLFVVDQDRPIAICGDTRIEGKAMLPQAGLKRAYIEGKNYTGDEMFYGTRGLSAKNLPPLDEAYISSLAAVRSDFVGWDNSEDSIFVSFAEAPLHFVDDGTVTLANIVLEGQIMIESRDSIYVAATAQLENVILKSPVIYIQNGFSGTVQLLGSKKVVLEENVRLLYPSVIGLVEEEFPAEHSSQITIGSRSQVIGSVFLFSRDPNFRLPVQLNIAPFSAIDGFVYCNGKTQLRGTVNGHLYTDKFYLETQSSKYENHLLDAKVLDQLPEEFIYINLVKSTNPLKRIEWLD